MTLFDVRNSFKSLLSDNYPDEEVLSLFYILADHVLGYSRFDVSQHLTDVLDDKQHAHFDEALQRLAKNEPIQYILGETEFYGLPITVTPATLIPRPETEELVAWIIEDATKAAAPSESVLDIGTGSGCIAIALASHLEDCQLSALDVSQDTLKIAKKNAIRNGVTIDFFQQDILNTTSLPQQYDVMVSNPPYVREKEKKAMQANVLGHEPEIALFVTDEDPLLFYRKITEIAAGTLSPKGTLYFEINEYLSEEMLEMVAKLGFTSVQLKNDMFGKPRMLRCRRF